MEPMKYRSFGFSLIELLVVIAILGILLGALVPATSSLLESTNVTRGGQLVESQVQLARQLASSRNRPVEIRLIKVASLPMGGLGAIQLWQVDPPQGTNNGVARPVTRVEYLPTGVCISEDSTRNSRLLTACPTTNAMPPSSPLAGSAYSAVQIRPSGLVSPPINMNSLYMTVVPARFGNSNELPNNFATIQINPLTATPRTYRP